MPELDLNNPDDLIEQIAQDLAARKGVTLAPAAPSSGDDLAQDPQNTAPAGDGGVDPASTTPPPAAATTPAAPPTQPAPGAEPFPGYSTLSPEVKAQYDAVRAEAAANKARADREAQRAEQLGNNYSSLYNRVAPMQREFDRVRQQGAAANPGGIPSMQQWLARQTPERQKWFEDYPDDAKMQYELARDLIAEGQTAIQKQIADMQMQNEMQALSAQHPDWVQFSLVKDPRTGNYVPRSKESADYWSWVQTQPPETQQMADASAAEIAKVLSIYKWELANPEYREAIAMPEYQQWARAMPRTVTGLIYSTDPEERKLVLSWFLRDYDEAAGAATQDPEALKAQEIAARRDRQARQVAPSVRGTAAPASAAAGGSSDDAAIEDIYQRRKQRESAGR